MPTTDTTARSDLFEMRIASVSEVGDRAVNQDALACVHKDHLTCLIVSDGAGGHAGGEVASRMVVDAVVDSFLRELTFSPRALQSYLQQASDHVAAGRRAAATADMSATVAVVLIDQDNQSVICGHLGDTRIYLFRAGRLQQVTKDHSMVQQFVDAGYLSADQMRVHPKRSVLFAAIGPVHEQSPIVSADPIALVPGDALLICTDGLWEWLTDEELLVSLQQSHNPDEWLASLCKKAAANSQDAPRQRDNYSAQAVWFFSSINQSSAP